MKYTELPSDCFEALATNAGILLTEFTPISGEFVRENIIGATTGGINATCVPSYADWGADVDNCPKGTKELKHIENWECKISGTFISVTSTAMKMLIGANSVDGEKIVPINKLTTADFKNIWYVCDYGDTDGSYIAVKLIDALSTGGFSMQSTDKAKGQFAFEFTGHSSTESVDTVPMEFYLHKEA